MLMSPPEENRRSSADRFDNCRVVIAVLAVWTMLILGLVLGDAVVRSGSYLPEQARMISATGMADLSLAPPASIFGYHQLKSGAVDLRHDPLLPLSGPDLTDTVMNGNAP